MESVGAFFLPPPAYVATCGNMFAAYRGCVGVVEGWRLVAIEAVQPRFRFQRKREGVMSRRVSKVERDGVHSPTFQAPPIRPPFADRRSNEPVHFPTVCHLC